MSKPVSTPSANPPRAGRLTAALGRLFLKQATVISAQHAGGGFHVIELEAPGFSGAAFSPGQKLQIAVGPSFTYRTYTPIDWDGERGRTRIIAYAHGDGPGSAWIRNARVGDSCEVFGPRASLAVADVTRPALLFGDETSFGLAAAMQQQSGGALRCLFEVNSTEQLSAALDLDSFGITGARLFARASGDRHLAQVETSMRDEPPATSFVLTGKAPSIQRLRIALKRLGVPGNRVLTKAYWAPGKKGLD